MTMPLDAFINPCLLSAVCGKTEQSHTGDLVTNHPCGHKGQYSSCLTWSPAAGCICRERFGAVTHGGPSSGARPIPPATTTPAAPPVTNVAAKP